MSELPSDPTEHHSREKDAVLRIAVRRFVGEAEMPLENALNYIGAIELMAMALRNQPGDDGAGLLIVAEAAAEQVRIVLEMHESLAVAERGEAFMPLAHRRAL